MLKILLISENLYVLQTLLRDWKQIHKIYSEPFIYEARNCFKRNRSCRDSVEERGNRNLDSELFLDCESAVYSME
jgi:hypothetical protein